MVTISTGNTLLPPPKLSGDPAQDVRALLRWVSDLFDQIAKVQNVAGTLNDHETRIASLETQVAAIRKHFGI